MEVQQQEKESRLKLCFVCTTVRGVAARPRATVQVTRWLFCECKARLSNVPHILSGSYISTPVHVSPDLYSLLMSVFRSSLMFSITRICNVFKRGSMVTRVCLYVSRIKEKLQLLLTISLMNYLCAVISGSQSW